MLHQHVYEVHQLYLLFHEISVWNYVLWDLSNYNWTSKESIWSPLTKNNTGINWVELIKREQNQYWYAERKPSYGLLNAATVPGSENAIYNIKYC